MKKTRRIMTALLVMLVLSLCPVMQSFAESEVGSVKKIGTAVTHNTAYLTWQTVSGADGYNVYSVDDEGESKLLKATPKNTLAIKNLQPGTEYSYQIFAYDEEGEGQGSPVVTIKTRESKLAAPKGLKATGYGNKSITLGWDKVKGATGYYVKQYMDGEYVTIASVKTNSYTVEGLKTGSKYRFRVQAFDKEDGFITVSTNAYVAVTAKNLAQLAKEVKGRCYNTTLRSTMQLLDVAKDKKITVKAGTKIIVSWGSGKNLKGYLPNGTQVIIPKSDDLKYHGLEVSRSDYSTNIKEAYVNSKGYSSKSDYLIWVNQYTCYTTIFKGEKGSWKAVRSMPCVVGQIGSGLTKTGVYTLCRRDSAYGGPRVYFYWNGSMGWGDAFHLYVNSQTWGAGSHGCVRLKSADLYYLVNNCPMGTTVVSN